MSALSGVRSDRFSVLQAEKPPLAWLLMSDAFGRAMALSINPDLEMRLHPCAKRCPMTKSIMPLVNSDPPANKITKNQNKNGSLSLAYLNAPALATSLLIDVINLKVKNADMKIQKAHAQNGTCYSPRNRMRAGNLPS
jgi:hypothetical protein